MVIKYPFKTKPHSFVKPSGLLPSSIVSFVFLLILLSPLILVDLVASSTAIAVPLQQTVAAESQRANDVRISPSPIVRNAAAGHTAFYVLSVTNLGTEPDRYAISVEGNNWPVTILAADSVTKVIQTSTIQSDSLVGLVAQIDVPISAAIGTSDTMRIFAASLADSTVRDFAFLRIFSIGRTAPLPFTESFSEGVVNTERWIDNFGPAHVRANALNPPSPPFALNLNGASTGGDTLQSQPVDLGGNRDVVLQFAYQRGGGGNAPEPADDLFVEYYNHDGEWQRLVRLPGAGPVMMVFALESFLLPVDAYHSSFRIRFRNLATPGPFDDWYLDDISISKIEMLRLPFEDTYPTMALDTDKWPQNVNAVVDSLGLNLPSRPFALHLSGGAAVQSAPIDLSTESSVSLRYFFQQADDNQEPDSGDDLLLEYRDAADSWRELSRHLGSGGSLPVFTFNQVLLPAAAYHRHFSLRIRNIGSEELDDWFVDDLAIEVFAPPQIAVQPSSIQLRLFEGDSTSEQLTIENLGLGELFYRFRIEQPEKSRKNRDVPSAYPHHYYLAETTKGLSDQRRGRVQNDTRGGPDRFGYTWISSKDPRGPTFSWQDIAGIGTPVAGAGDDDNVGPFEIDFSFPFYDAVFEEIRICTNGFASFTSSSPNFHNTPIPGASIANLIAPFWDDLDLSQGMIYFWSDSGKAILQWENARRFAGDGPYDFQVVLNANGDILFQYLRIAGPNSFATTGIQSESGREGLEVAFNTDFVQDSLAVLVKRPANWLLLRPSQGVVASNGLQEVRARFDATGLEPDSVYSANFNLLSNDVEQPSIPISFQLEVLSIDDSLTHFPPTDTTGREVYPIVVERAELNGQPLAAGDEIGVFTTAGVFAGAVVWRGNSMARLFALGDDVSTPTLDGFLEGETIHYRIWDSSRGDRDFAANANYTLGDGRFGTGDSAVVSLLFARTSLSNTTPFSSKWSWVSFNVEPDVPDIPTLFADVEELQIMKNGAGQAYIPGFTNTIPALDPLDGYAVYLDAPDTLEIIGEEIAPFTPIPLTSGWNFIGYLPSSPILAPLALQSIYENLAIAKDDLGRFFIPEFNDVNSIGSMMPGKGYKVYLEQADTLTYPISSPFAPGISVVKSISLPAVDRERTQHFETIADGSDSYTIVIRNAVFENQPLQAGDEIAVFTPDRSLAGAAVWQPGAITVLTAWRGEGARSLDVEQHLGFQSGENMHFKIWLAEVDQEFEAKAVHKKGDGTFDAGPFAVVELTAGNLPASFELAQNYPNPFHLDQFRQQETSETIIRYALPEASHVTLKIYNMLGQEVVTLREALQPAGRYRVSWDGRDRFNRRVSGGVYLYRMEAGDFVAIRKLLVL